MAVVIIIVLIIFTLPETIKKYNYTKKIEKFESLSFTKTYTKTNDITLLEPASWFMGFISYAEIVVAPHILAPGLYKKFFFLILVSISPLSIIFMVNRPELLGLMFLIIGIFFYLKSNKDISRSSLNLFLSGFFLGLSVITHPIYFFFNLFFFHSMPCILTTCKKISIIIFVRNSFYLI